jgi:hypothetical protein
MLTITACARARRGGAGPNGACTVPPAAARELPYVLAVRSGLPVEDAPAAGLRARARGISPLGGIEQRVAGEPARIRSRQRVRGGRDVA